MIDPYFIAVAAVILLGIMAVCFGVLILVEVLGVLFEILTGQRK